MQYNKRIKDWQRFQRSSRRGMSLVEVMVVIAIIVVIMGVVGFGALTAFENSRVSTTQLAMHDIGKMVDIAALKKGPPSSSDGLTKVYGSQKPPTDSWNNEFIYLSPGPNGAKYDIISYGADGVEGGEGNDADIKWSEKSNW